MILGVHHVQITIPKHAAGLNIEHQFDPLGGRKILFKSTGPHLRLAAAISDCHSFGPEQARLHRCVYGGHAAPDNDDIAPNGKLGQIIGLSQISNEIDRVDDTFLVCAFCRQSIDASQPDAKENRIVIGAQGRKFKTGTQRLPRLDGNATDRKQPVHLTRGKIIG